MEIVSSTIGSIVENISKPLFGAADHHIGFLLHYSDNIEALRKQAKKLQATKGDIQLMIDAAKRNNEVILLEVQNWITEAENVSAEAEKFLEDEGKASKRCFKGCCIDLRSRYRFNKAAKQKIAVMTRLQVDVKFKPISQPAPPPPGIISSSVEDFDARNFTDEH